MKDLSTIQEAIWLTQNIYTDSSLYNVGGYALIEGELNEPALIASIEEVLADADAIETGYYAFNDKPLDENHRFVKCDISSVDFSLSEIPDQSCREWIDLDIREKLNAGKSLLKVRILKAGEHRHYWYTKVHHLVFDGYAMSLFFNSVAEVYSAHINNKNRDSKRNLHAYSDFIEEEKEYRRSKGFSDDRDFWFGRLSGLTGVKGFQSCFQSATALSLSSSRQEIVISRDFYDRIKRLCDTYGCSVFHYFLSSIFVLNKCYNNEMPAIGIPVFNRRSKNFKNTLGAFVNVLPFTLSLQENQTFSKLLISVKDELKACYKHQRFPSYCITEELNREGTFYNLLFSYQKNDYTAHLGDSCVAINYIHSGEQQEDIAFHLLEYSEDADLKLVVDYRKELFHEKMVEGILRSFSYLLHLFLESPNLPVQTVKILSEEESHRILTAFNDTKADFSREKTLLDLFEDQVAKTPDRIAVVMKEKTSLTYKQLDERSARLGHYLRIHYLIGPNDIVAVKLYPGDLMIIAILGILKAGAAYLPVDPDYPEERVAYILSDSGCKVILDGAEMERFAKIGHSPGPESHRPTNKSTDLAYVIYTSGSTGRPKGCMLEHRGIINRLEWMWRQFEFDADDVILQKTTFTFDVSVWEIFLPLCMGAKMVLCQKEDARSPERILDLIKEYKITCLHFVPGMFAAFVRTLTDDDTHLPLLKSLRRIIASGEELLAETVKSWYDIMDIPVHNLYGPTEASIDVTYYTTSWKDTRIPIGRPIWNMRMYITDKYGHLLPIGVEGEICIAGIGLSKGYLNRPELTAQKFVEDPFFPGERMYRTGDLGRWMADGNIEFLGRMDTQVKIRGYRIELGEIESILQEHPAIDAAVILAPERRESGKELAAYIISKVPVVSGELRAYLATILPDYMVPSRYIRVEIFPMTSSGKIDRKKLLDTAGTLLSDEIAYVSPKDEIEEGLILIWQDILGKERIGIKDNFFISGGHSLKAMRLTGRIHKEFDVKLTINELFSAPILEMQAQLIRQAKRTIYSRIVPVGNQPHYPLSSGQRRLWVLSQLTGGNRAYNMAGVHVFEGNLNLAALEKSFNMLLRRHQSLRTVFKEDEQGNIRQYINPPDHVRFSISTRSVTKESDIDRLLLEACERPFNLDSGPLLHAELYPLSATRSIFVYVMHHILGDGWSMDILTKELSIYYNACCKNTVDMLHPLAIQYKDYAAWQQDQLLQGKLLQHKAYWLQQLQGELPALVLPGANKRPVIRTYAGGTIRKTLDAGLTRKLKSLVQSQGATLFMGVVSLVYTLLHRYSSQEDIVIGIPVAGREHPDLQDQIGLYVNTLALRIQFKGDDTFDKLLSTIKNMVLEGYEHQAYPFDELVNDLQLQWDMSRNALFDVMVIFQNAEGMSVNKLEWNDLHVSPYEGLISTVSKLDLTFNFEEAGENLLLQIEYNSVLYDKVYADQMARHLLQILRCVVEQPFLPIRQLNFLEQPEQRQLLVAFNQTETEYVKDRVITDLFELQVVKTPDDIAVIFENDRLTYAQLNESANQFANYLRRDLECRRGDLVGLKVSRNEWMVIAMLGILKAGGAYVPIDPEYPLERRNYILENSKCRILIDDEELDKFKKRQAAYDIHNPEFVADQDDLAYIIYTSGSTGQPKGIMIEHRNAVAFINWCGNEFLTSDFEVVLASTSICFDLSIFEIFYTLSTGKKLRVLKNGLSIPQYIAIDKKILINAVPSVIGFLLDEKPDLGSVSVLNMAGEQIPGKYLLKLDCRRMEIRNLYGPSETTTYSTAYRIGDAPEILIGKPIHNTYIYILNEAMILQPIGVTGEICIGGDGVARGYLDNPELTREKFIADPFRKGKRIYKTGDLGRWLPDGNIEMAGRKDHQIKIRGYRIEPDEIESALQRHKDIDSALVLAKWKDEEKRLVAYFVSRTLVKAPEIRDYLSGLLPVHMVPDYLVQLESWPLNLNGKIAREKLPDPEDTVLIGCSDYVAPRNAIEEKLVLIWQEILGAQTIGIKDNFFTLGGHSMKAAKLVSEINHEFKVRLNLESIFTDPRIENIADRISFILEQHKQKKNKANLIEIEI